MESPFRDDEDIDDILKDLENAKRRTIKISSHVDKLCSRAYDEGLSDASLDKLVDIITLPNELDQGSIGKLIKNLYPVDKVTDSIVIKVIGCLGHGQAKPSYASQAALLKWLIMVYDVLANQKILSQLYAVIFNLLDTIALRMQWARQAGHDPALVGLMRVYKDYYPEVIVGDVTMGRASHPNREWKERLGEIQENHLQRTQDGLLSERRNFRVARKSAKERKHSVVPPVHTSYAHETSTTLEEVEDVDDFVSKLEKIELPNQLVAAIDDPLLQKFLQLKPFQDTQRRIDHWLLAFFEDQLEDGRSSEIEIPEMLQAVLGYTRFTKQLPATCLSYLRAMMPTWNGITNRGLVLDLLSYLPIGSFTELYENTFLPLEDAILDNSPEQCSVLLDFYTSLLNQWCVILLAQESITKGDSAALDALMDHGNELALRILQDTPSVAACCKILSFYETNASLISNTAMISKVRINIPPSQLVYALYFSPSLPVISRLCNILAIYKRAFEVAMAPGSGCQPYPKDYVNHFNGFLMDLCNCLWRSRAFNKTDVNALGCLLPEKTAAGLEMYISRLDTGLSLSSLFSLSYSPAICHFAISYVRELEDQAGGAITIQHAGPVTQASLKRLSNDGGLAVSWQDYRLGVLRYLEERGFSGVGELMYNTMKHLMSARERT
ncbi:Mis6 domain-containing protein [Rutstroemia sp. NJR-2017a WRK4]|nr:Mis6 domain-containing protein [Rutstroemia sp. NJR-2017a WRK4]